MIQKSKLFVFIALSCITISGFLLQSCEKDDYSFYDVKEKKEVIIEDNNFENLYKTNSEILYAVSLLDISMKNEIINLANSYNATGELDSVYAQSLINTIITMTGYDIIEGVENSKFYYQQLDEKYSYSSISETEQSEMLKKVLIDNRFNSSHILSSAIDVNNNYDMQVPRLKSGNMESNMEECRTNCTNDYLSSVNDCAVAALVGAAIAVVSAAPSAGIGSLLAIIATVIATDMCLDSAENAYNVCIQLCDLSNQLL